MLKKRIIAKVDGSEIYYWQYLDAMMSFASEVLKKPLEELSPTERETCSTEALNKVIASELFYLEAFEAGVTVSDEELKMAYLEFINTLEGGKFDTFLSEREITEEEFRDYLKKQLIKDRFVNALLKKIPEPQGEEIEKFYEKVRDKLYQPPHFSFYLAFVEDPSDEIRETFKRFFGPIANKRVELPLAEKILDDLKNEILGLRVVYYEDKSGEKLALHVKNLLLSIEDGTFSPIFEAPSEISIFYMKKKELHLPLSEEEKKVEAERYYRIARLKKILDAYVESLKEKRKIEVFL